MLTERGGKEREEGEGRRREVEKGDTCDGGPLRKISRNAIHGSDPADKS
jgi:hypothetical protein